MKLPDLGQWRLVGSNESARYFLAENGVIVVIPHQDCVDTEHTARAAIALQMAHWQSVGRPGASIVMMDPIQHQEAGARRVYQREIAAESYTCIALVTDSIFGRAVASIFLGLASPPVPTKMFADLDTALTWVRQINASRWATSRG